MTNAEAIERLSLLKIFDAPGLNKAVKIAITALRAQQPPAKLDRSRWEKCDACSDEAAVDFFAHKRMVYCPYCGRPLAEEAWAELERRIGGNDGTADDA